MFDLPDGLLAELRHQAKDTAGYERRAANLEELARMVMAWIGSRVVDDPAAAI